MSLKDRLAKLEDEGPERCDACSQVGVALAHDPEDCDKEEQEALFPSLRAFTRAGWFRPNAPKHQHVPISDETRALLNSGALVVDGDHPDNAALAELAKRELQLWRCKEKRYGPVAKPCPKCGSLPDVLEVIHSHGAAMM
jgi:hypothetical protein